MSADYDGRIVKPFSTLAEVAEQVTAISTEISARGVRLTNCEKEIDSLRESRHAHGNHLTAHLMEINSLKQSMSEGHLRRIQSLEHVTETLSTAVSTIQSDMRVLAWKVGAITGIVIVIANQLLSRIHL